MSQAALVKIPATIRPANVVPVLASLGIHGLLLAVLPFVSLNSPDIRTQRTIEIVELTPAEQSRLPQVTTQAALPDFANQPSELPPAPPPPFQFDALPPLPPSTLQSDILPPLPPLPPPPVVPPSTLGSVPIIQNPLPSQPKTLRLPIAPPLQKRPFISRFPFGQLPPAPTSKTGVPQQQISPRSRSSTTATNSGLPSTRGLKPSEPFLPNTIPPSSTAQQNANQSQNQVARADRDATPPVISNRSSLPKSTKKELIALRNKLSEQSAANRTQTPPAAQPTPSDRSQRLAALQQRLQQQRQETPPATQPTPSDRSQRLAALQQRLQISDRNSSVSPKTANTIAQIENYQERQQRIQQEIPQIETKAPIRDKIKTCNKQLDGNVAILGAVVSPEGKITSGPDLISNNKAAEVQQAAKAYVRQYSFPKTDNPTNQQFRLEFQHNPSGCPASSEQQAEKLQS